jgi:ketosteroid isomerase-like protein
MSDAAPASPASPAAPAAADLADLRARVARLEATEQIRQLVARYALALDARDVETIVSLFVPDVVTGDGGEGRAALAEWFDGILRPYRITFHLIGNHTIRLHDDTHATGIVYCRPEHEVGEDWIVMPMQYWDRYECRDGEWLFASRKPVVFYAVDVLEHPLRVPERFRFPGNPMLDRAELPERWETWRAFWSRPEPDTD